MTAPGRYRKKQTKLYRALQYTGDNAEQLSFLAADNLRVRVVDGKMRPEVGGLDDGHWQALRVDDWIVWDEDDDTEVKPWMAEHFHSFFEPAQDLP